MPEYQMRGTAADDTFPLVPGSSTQPVRLRATNRLAAIAEALELLGVVVEPVPEINYQIGSDAIMQMLGRIDPEFDPYMPTDLACGHEPGHVASRLHKDGRVCTRKVGHNGMHAMHNGDGLVLAIWSGTGASFP